MINNLKKNISLVILMGVSWLFVSCVTNNPFNTYNSFNPYPNLQTHDYQNAFLYEMGNLASDMLVINIEGSGWGSTLGRRGGIGVWMYTGMTAQTIQPLWKDYTFILPEKWKRNPREKAGVNSGVYYEDLDARLLYTLENLIENYAESINIYLSDNTFESIFLVGSSEGAIILPLLYEKISDKEKIKGMVVYAGGGLALYDSLKILSTAKITPRQLRKEYAYVIENYDRGIEQWSNSIGVDKYGNVLLWLTSFLEFCPFDYYKNINIPVLFIHGERDYNVSVESTRYIQENLPEKTFEYIYYRKMAHGPNPWSLGYTFQFHKIRNDIAKWINKIENIE
jgi:dienelactone hydrolase